MRIEVNGARLFFEVVGTRLRLEGPPGSERPSLIILHGGPGFDHTGFRNYFDRFSDAAQVIYLDHRGNGRSDRSTPDRWTLAQWGDDVRAFCDVLDLKRPIVFGNSFGGFVAQAYAVANPSHAGGLILSSTAARFDMEGWARRIEARAGVEARAIAEAYWETGSEEVAQRFAAMVMPLYVTPGNERDRQAAAHGIRRTDVARHFFHQSGEGRRFDFRPRLADIQCPVLVLSGGEGDLATPPEGAGEIATAIGPARCELAVFESAKHGAFRDVPEDFEATMRDFIARLAGGVTG